MYKQYITNEEKLQLVKEAYERGFIVIPTRRNSSDGRFNIPIWRRKVEKQEWNFEKFKEVVKIYTEWGFGLLTGQQRNKLYLNCLDFDIDIVKKGTKEPIVALTKLFPKVLQGIEETQSGRYHFFFFTKEKLKKFKPARSKGWIKYKNGEERQGEIELRNESFTACYEGIIKDFDKKPVTSRNLPVLDLAEVKEILQLLGFEELDTITQLEKDVNELVKEYKNEAKTEDKNLRDIKEEIKRRIKIEDLLYELSGTFEVKAQHGNRLDCLCPFKSERNPSFKIFNTENGQFWADFHLYHDEFGYNDTCKLTAIGGADAVVGDIFDIYQIFTGATFKQSLIDLGKKAGFEDIEEIVNKVKVNTDKAERVLTYAFDNINQIIFFDKTQSKFLIYDEDTKEVYYLDKDAVKIVIEKAIKELYPDEEIKVKDVLSKIEHIEKTIYKPETAEKIVKANGKKYFNLYTSTEFDTLERTDELDEIDLTRYPAVKILLENLTRKNERKIKYILSWIAFKLKFKKKVGVAITFWGKQGSGKGLLANKVLKTIFNTANVNEISLSDLESQFNSWIQSKLIIIANEIKIDYEKNNRTQNMLKAYITDEDVYINEKHMRRVRYTNYADFLIFSNHDDPVRVEQSDRRFFIIMTGDPLVDARTQNIINTELKEKFGNMQNFVKALEEEAKELAKDLLKLKVDINKLRYDIWTEEKAQMLRRTMSQFELFIESLKNKDYETLFESFDVNNYIKNNIINDSEKIQTLKGLIQLLNGFIEVKYISFVYRAIMNDRHKSDKALKDAFSSNFYKTRIKVNSKDRRIAVIDNEIEIEKIKSAIKELENIENKIYEEKAEDEIEINNMDRYIVLKLAEILEKSLADFNNSNDEEYDIENIDLDEINLANIENLDYQLILQIQDILNNTESDTVFLKLNENFVKEVKNPNEATHVIRDRELINKHIANIII